MKRNDTKSVSGGQPVSTAKQGKKPYQSPAWEVEETFGAAGAVACQKVDDSSCAGGPIQS